MGNHLWQKTRNSPDCDPSKFVVKRCKTALTSRMHSGYLWQCQVCTHCSPPGEQMEKLYDVQLAGPRPTLPRRLGWHSQQGQARGRSGQSSFITFTETHVYYSLACGISFLNQNSNHYPKEMMELILSCFMLFARLTVSSCKCTRFIIKIIPFLFQGSEDKSEAL